MFGHSAPWNLKSFHVTEDEELFAERIYRLWDVFGLEPFLPNANLQLLLIDFVAEEDDFLAFLSGVHSRQAFQTSLSSPDGVLSGQKGGLDDK